MVLLTVDSVSTSIYENLLTTLIQDIVARTAVNAQRIRSCYGDEVKPYYHDDLGKTDILGRPKQQDSSIYFHCENCNRDVSANRFAAHIERCLSRGRRR
ncbi:LAMI_0A01376g1_1 [Lachancea mirantina]|uniref:SAGA-associated factor 11 n=1 Tax=Lachancea mirantina TaxID=1230905 RepID=A0A1G4ILP2_9SACH|nr:LAMI_0A01376g1_1 [Lachancea mirantina]